MLSNQYMALARAVGTPIFLRDDELLYDRRTPDVSMRVAPTRVPGRHPVRRRTAYLLVIAGSQVVITALTKYPQGTKGAAILWLAVTLWMVYLIYRGKTIAWELLTALSATVVGALLLAAGGLVTIWPQGHGWWLTVFLISTATLALLFTPTVRPSLRGHQANAR